jgi:hypothetical protein
MAIYSQEILSRSQLLGARLESLPNGFLITFLKNKLSQDDFADAVSYIWELILETVYHASDPQLQIELNQLASNNNFLELSEVLSGLVESSPELQILIWQILETTSQDLKQKYKI